LAGLTDLNFGGQLRTVGHRRCPSPACRTYVLVVLDHSHELVASYPPEVVDFDATNVPTAVVAALEEAIKCHAVECYVAAAIMVRGRPWRSCVPSRRRRATP
jgi:hypothetical protein